MNCNYCDLILTSPEMFIKCDKCRYTVYCDETCQQNHLVKHKGFCDDYCNKTPSEKMKFLFNRLDTSFKKGLDKPKNKRLFL